METKHLYETRFVIMPRSSCREFLDNMTIFFLTIMNLYISEDYVIFLDKNFEELKKNESDMSVK